MNEKRSYRDFKIAAKFALRGRLTKIMVVYMFIVMLTVAANLFSMKFTTENYYINILIQGLIILLVLEPFSMGAVTFNMAFLKGNNYNVGMIFDGYKYFFKILPYSVISILVSVAYNFIFNRYADTIFTSLLSQIIVFAALLIMTVIKLCMSFTYYYVYDNPEISGFGAVIKSFKILRKNIMYYIGLNLSFVWWVFGITFTYGALMLYVYPYMEITKIIYYKYLMEQQINNSAVQDEEVKENE